MNKPRRRVIRKSEVKRQIGASDSTIDRWEAAGDFPERIQLSSNSVGWFEDEVQAWIATRKRGLSKAPEKANAARRKGSSESRQDTRPKKKPGSEPGSGQYLFSDDRRSQRQQTKDERCQRQKV